MTYVDAFINEVLRLHPPVGMLIRRSPPHWSKLGDVDVPPNSRLVLATELTQIMPAYWENPNTFDPERWLDEERKSLRHPMQFSPFGAGPRKCIGYKFALMEAKLLLAPIVRAFRFALHDPEQLNKFTTTNFITSRPKPTMLLKLQKRN